MSECCLQLVSGAPPQAGGEVGWECVVDIDWQAEFNRQGAVDLNAVGASLVDENGAVWNTPAVANGDPADMTTGSTSFGLTANGIEVVDCANAGMNPTGSGGFTPLIYIQLADLASAWGFEADPTRMYMFQSFVSIQENADDDIDHSGVALWKYRDTPHGDEYMAQHGSGFYTAGPGLANRATVENPVGLDVVTRNDGGARNVVMLQYAMSGELLNYYAVDWAGDFPAFGAHRFTAAGSIFDNNAPGIVGDTIEAFIFGIFHQANSTTQTYRAVHQRTRVCRF